MWKGLNSGRLSTKPLLRDWRRCKPGLRERKHLLRSGKSLRIEVWRRTHASIWHSNNKILFRYAISSCFTHQPQDSCAFVPFRMFMLLGISHAKGKWFRSTSRNFVKFERIKNIDYCTRLYISNGRFPFLKMPRISSHRRRSLPLSCLRLFCERCLTFT